jgi:8-oxo-dGTP diphosphatase
MSHEIVAALILQSDRILLGRRSAARAFYPDVWDVFGGHVEPGEHHQATLVREMQEDLDITPTRWTFVETLTRPLPADLLIVHLYLVTAWSGVPVNRQSEEHSEIGWFSLEEAIGLPLADPSYPELFGRFL